MALSARNQLQGTVVQIKEGAVMAEIIVRLENGLEMVSVITLESAHRLKLTVGGPATVVVKSTDVMIAAAES